MTTARALWQSLFVLAVLVAGTVARAEPTRSATDAPETPRLTHGVASGEVTATSAVVWARCDRAGELHGTLRDPTRHDTAIAAPAAVDAKADFTGKIHFDGLRADIAYEYRCWCSQGESNRRGAANTASGTLRTAPKAGDRKPLSFAWSGDLAGQNVCRDPRYGYAIFKAIQTSKVNFFVALGDMVYADDPCQPRGRFGDPQIEGPRSPAMDLAGFWAYWKYNREDDAFRRFLASTPYYAVWDDHEVFNDFGPHHDVSPKDPSGRHLLPIGLQAFLDYNPLVPTPTAPKRLYRSVRWGKHLELFLLDTRQYRDPNFAEDDPEHPKTMLGIEQRAWLEKGLQRSDATWKVIVSSVPMSVPTGQPERGRDGWANVDQKTGFEHELIGILRFMHDHGIRNQLWITTDVHFGSVFRYTPFSNDPAFQVHEVTTGPLNAGVFPKHEFDTTLGTEQLFLFGPENPDAVHSFDEERRWFNFGIVRIDEGGTLAVDIVDATGRSVYRLALPPR